MKLAMAATMSNLFVVFFPIFLVVVRFHKSLSIVVISHFFLDVKTVSGCFDILLILNMYSGIRMLSSFLTCHSLKEHRDRILEDYSYMGRLFIFMFSWLTSVRCHDGVSNILILLFLYLLFFVL